MMRGDGRGTSPIHVGVYRQGSSVLIDIQYRGRKDKGRVGGVIPARGDIIRDH